jgi:ABC-type glycerol-3-phosphate transport system substrate-binding protein
LIQSHRAAAVALLAALVSIVVAGCPKAPSATPAKTTARTPSQPLVLLVVEDPQLGKAIAREWRGRTEEELTVRDASVAEIAAASRLPGDAVVFPAGLIGQLAERGLIVPLADAALEDADFNYRDIFDQIRLREMRWGNRTLAAPLGSPRLLLAYRADLFEQASLAPPADWPAYQEAVTRLADRAALGDLAPAADRPWRAAVEPLADGWAGQMLLARAAAYAMHRDQVSPLFRFESAEPLIDQPPYVRALEEFVAAAKAGDFADQRHAPAEALAELKVGRAAMAIAWPAPDPKGAESAAGAKIAFAKLPGSAQVYRFATRSWDHRAPDEESHVPLLSTAGRMAAVSSSSSDPRRAEGFVVWLAGREVSQQVGPHSTATTLFRRSQIAASSRWTGSLSPESSRQYAEVLAETLSTPRAFPGLTLPGRLDYLAALDEAVHQAISGKLAPKEALEKAAARWREITKKLDEKKQQRANARSLGQATF